ncbi:unnamed protein product [Bursaphelenchus xylophilus]|uniref:(pine wood nematode) hypothetical protein n=1 Tax=Bursaphelenchus xylophilus TaxID=6326 RepID=A0A7I8XLU1_BURXY|nr:unnamed protein product [Bursaphelenchus xylophilus]CAG9090197.1 unnamed protein product [Bursaphelenchus xylophilus]
MFSTSKLFSLLLLVVLISSIHAQYDSSASGSILSPFGGGLGGGYSNPYGSFANSDSSYGRYGNAYGFL